MDNKVLKEAYEVISDGQEEISEEKKVVSDSRTGQTSIKIPKSLAVKKNLNSGSIFRIVFNPNKDSLTEAQESGFILYLKENKKDGEKEEGA